MRLFFYAVLGVGLAVALWMTLPKTVPEAVTIGGEFRLQNQRGETVTEKDLLGQYALVYFGYTTCPDVCPTDLYQMSRLAELLEQEPGLPFGLRPAFISIDPERDTVERLADYMQAFHPSFLALTGSAEAVKQAASAYKIYYRKAEADGSALGYLMDHSAYLYLMDPKGQYVTHYTHGMTAEALLKDVRSVMQQDAKK